jgi:hypothetical protein
MMSWGTTPVATPAQASVRNRLLAALSPADFSLLQPLLEPVPLPVRTCLAEPSRPIEHIYFLEQGITSVVASTPWTKSIRQPYGTRPRLAAWG